MIEPRVRCRSPYSEWTCSACNATISDRAPARHGLVCAACDEQGERGAPYIPLTIRPVKPRSNPPADVCGVSMSADSAILQSGEILTLDELVDLLAERAPGDHGRQLPAGTIIVCDKPIELIAYLDSRFRSDHFWQWSYSEERKTKWHPTRQARPRIVPRAGLFGWCSRRDGRRRAHGRSRYYRMIDPAAFNNGFRQAFADRSTGEDPAVTLLRLGVDLRDFCAEHNLPIPASSGAFATRALKDSRFFPDWRRKVPKFVNTRTRAMLPGNHNQLLCAPDVSIDRAHKLDMSGAHHQIAIRTQFPLADTLRAYGRFMRPPEDGAPYLKPDRRDIPAGHPLFKELIDQHGVFVLLLNVRKKLADDPLSLPSCNLPGRHYRIVYSNELPRLRQADRAGLMAIEGIAAAYVSPDVDQGLNEYAYWSLERLAEATPFRKQWLKPMLLATDGILAQKTLPRSTHYRWTKTPKPESEIGTNYGPLAGHECEIRPRENPVVNVIWRGLVEAGLRLETLAYARELQAAGHDVLCIYADAIFTRDTGQLPPLRRAWRHDKTLTRLIFYASTHYTSDQEQKLPGVHKGNQLDHDARIRRFRESFTKTLDRPKNEAYDSADRGVKNAA